MNTFNFRFKSAKMAGDYVDYYVWRKALDVKDDPNYIAEEGKENAYLAYDGKNPILNWVNPAVQESIFEVAKSFVDMGIDGFYVDRIGQLVKHLPKSEVPVNSNTLTINCSSFKHLKFRKFIDFIY